MTATSTRSSQSPAAAPADHDLELAKWLAIACMAANHVALALPPPWREAGILVGRASLPVFTLLIALRLRYDGEARAHRYLVRLLVWGLLAQPAYAYLLTGTPVARLNALFTLASGVSLVYLAATAPAWVSYLAAALVCAGGAWLDGGAWMPVALFLAWQWLRLRPRATCGAVAIVAVLSAAMNLPTLGTAWLPALVAATVPVLALTLSPRLSSALPRLPGVVFYGFYPAHLTAILAFHGPY